MKPEQEVQVVITLSDDALTKLGQVEKGLVGIGMSVDRVLGNIGIVRGRIRRTLIPALKRLDGIIDVQADKEVHLSPPKE